MKKERGGGLFLFAVVLFLITQIIIAIVLLSNVFSGNDSLFSPETGALNRISLVGNDCMNLGPCDYDDATGKATCVVYNSCADRYQSAICQVGP